MHNVATTAMKNSPWQGANGVITEGANPNSNNDNAGFKCTYSFSCLPFLTLLTLAITAVLIRALMEAFVRSDNNDFKNLIKSYTNVQVNVSPPISRDHLMLTMFSSSSMLFKT